MTQEHSKANAIGRSVPFWLAITAVILLGFNLRPGATSIGPLLAEIRDGLSMGTGTLSLLTAIPPFCFFAFGTVAARLGHRFGVNQMLAASCFLITAGLIGRVVFANEALFLILTIAALAGMAIGNVLLPVFVKTFFPNKVGSVMTVYTTVLPIGSLAPNLVIPLVAAVGIGWQGNLAVWGYTAAAALVVWVIIAMRAPRVDRPVIVEHARTIGLGDIARTKRGICLGLFFGTQSFQAYVAFGWIAQLLRDSGLSPTAASLVLSIYNVCGIPGGLLMPMVAEKVHKPRWLIWGLGAFLVSGYAGLLISPTTAPWLWVFFLGMASWAFPLALALVTARSRDAAVTAQVSGFCQSMGYLTAGIGTWLIGIIHGLTGGWTVPLVILASTSIVLVSSGLVASSPGYIDDELTARA